MPEQAEKETVPIQSHISGLASWVDRQAVSKLVSLICGAKVIQREGYRESTKDQQQLRATIWIMDINSMMEITFSLRFSLYPDLVNRHALYI